MLREDGVEIGDEDDLSTPVEKQLGRLVKVIILLASNEKDFFDLDVVSDNYSTYICNSA